MSSAAESVSPHGPRSDYQLHATYKMGKSDRKLQTQQSKKEKERELETNQNRMIPAIEEFSSHDSAFKSDSDDGISSLPNNLSSDSSPDVQSLQNAQQTKQFKNLYSFAENELSDGSPDRIRNTETSGKEVSP